MSETHLGVGMAAAAVEARLTRRAANPVQPLRNVPQRSHKQLLGDESVFVSDRSGQRLEATNTEQVAFAALHPGVMNSYV